VPIQAHGIDIHCVEQHTGQPLLLLHDGIVSRRDFRRRHADG
jgi:hypothetical protein